MARGRAWHEEESRRRRTVKGLLKALVGIGVPVAVLLLVITSNTPKPGEQPPPPRLVALDDAAGDDAGLDGVWRVADGSWAGYRILERIPRLQGRHEAVGRSEAVDGILRISGATVEEARVTVDARELTSDQPNRDEAIRHRFLESEDHPEASFELDAPLSLLGLPEPGEVVQLSATGRLTLHGETNPVQAPLEVVWDGDEIRVVGALRVTLADFGVRPPRLWGFRFVEDVGDIELDLRFVRDDDTARAAYAPSAADPSAPAG